MANSELIESCGCDWLTMTWPASYPHWETLSGLMYESIDELQGKGHKAKQHKIMQYDGVQAGKLFWGRNDTHFYLNASSYQAHDTAKTLIEGKVLGNATRCDLEITAAYKKREKDYFKKLRERIGESDLGINQRKPEKGAHYFCTSRDTGLAFGGKKADRTSRIYSAREGGHPEHSENAVRFEWQYRQGRARQIMSMMASAVTIETVATSVVTGELMALGIKEPWMDTGIGKKLKPLETNADIAKRFEWYNSQVFPSFAKTIAEGYGEELLQQLIGHLATRENIPRNPTALELNDYKKLFNKE